MMMCVSYTLLCELIKRMFVKVCMRCSYVRRKQQMVTAGYTPAADYLPGKYASAMSERRSKKCSINR